MKRFFILCAVAFCAFSCSTYTYTPTTHTTPVVQSKSKLINTASYTDVNIQTPVVPPVIADLDISKNKIKYHEFPSEALLKTDFENILNTAIKNALEINGNADVLIGLEYQVKTNDAGVIETVTVTGYPAKYTNFRHPAESIWLNNETLYHDKKDK